MRQRLGKIKVVCIYNRESYQKVGSVECGAISLLFVFARFASFDDSFEHCLLETFTDDKEDNERKALRFFTSGHID